MSHSTPSQVLWDSHSGPVESWGQSADKVFSQYQALKIWDESDRVEQAIRAAVANRPRSFRICFPVVPDRAARAERGRLVWAEVTVCNRFEFQERVGFNRLLFAPWTFYLPRGENCNGEVVAFQTLCDTLPSALSSTGWKEDSNEVFLLSLNPLHPQDVAWRGGWANRLTAITALTPYPLDEGSDRASLTISGPSLGLAVGLAAAAAARQYRLRPLIATGQLLKGGAIGRVNDLVPKARACADFKGAANELLFVCPSDKDPAEQDAIGSLQPPPVDLKHLKDIDGDIVKRLFTDGFDNYFHWLMTDWPPRPFTGWTEDDAKPTFRHLGDVCRQPLGSPLEVVCWFDVDPAPLADTILKHVKPKGSARPEYGESVPLKLNVADVLHENPLSPDRLFAALKVASADDFATALKRAGKLILIVHDVKSQDLWPQINNSHRTTLARELKKIAATHHVILVFSDLHHKHWFDRVTKS